MASKNPFGQLQVRRDEEDEEFTPQTVQSSSAGPLFSNNTAAEKKKKKVRPEEKKKVEEFQPEEEEGFEVVNKKKPVHKRSQNEGEETAPEEKVKKHHLKNKGAYAERNNKVPTGKRQFERHSGTGRGREIAKNGAGGKHTWGTNPRNARDDEYNGDEDVFNRVLNAKPREEREQKEEKVQVEEATPVEEAPKEEVLKEETPAKEEQTDNFERRKKKKGQEAEVKPEELFVRPDNALNYTEYMQQLKEKNQALSTAPQRKVEVSSDLKPQLKDTNLAIGITTEVSKKQQKTKAVKKEENVLDVAFQTGDDYERRNDNRENRNYGKKKGPKFQFKNEDYPELK